MTELSLSSTCISLAAIFTLSSLGGTPNRASLHGKQLKTQNLPYFLRGTGIRNLVAKGRDFSTNRKYCEPMGGIEPAQRAAASESEYCEANIIQQDYNRGMF